MLPPMHRAFFAALTLLCGCAAPPRANPRAATALLSLPFSPPLQIAADPALIPQVAEDPPPLIPYGDDPPDAQTAPPAAYNPRPRLSPGEVPGVSGAIRIATSSISTCALRDDGTAICWGNFPVDLTGRVSSLQPLARRMVGWKGVRALTDGEGAVFALLRDGTVQGHYKPLEGVTGAASFHLGRKHPCELDVQGQVLCWEQYRIGQAQPRLMLGDAIQLDSKYSHACALTSRGVVLCWGDNASQQLGDGTLTAREQASPVVGLPPAVEIAVGGNHTCARDATGAVRCWGNNGYGQLGDDAATTESRGIPSPVPGITSAVQIAAGAYHTCALLRDGSVQCWGWNRTGQLGDGTTIDRHHPTPVLGLPLAAQVSTFGTHTCARLLSGKVACWGDNSLGQTGRP